MHTSQVIFLMAMLTSHMTGNRNTSCTISSKAICNQRQFYIFREKIHDDGRILSETAGGDDKNYSDIQKKHLLPFRNGSSHVQLSRPRLLSLDLSSNGSHCQPSPFQFRRCGTLIKTDQHISCRLYTNPTRRDLEIMSINCCTFSPLFLRNMHLHERKNSSTSRCSDIRLNEKINIETFTSWHSQQAILYKLKNMSILLLIILILITCRIYIHLFDNSYREHNGNLDYSKQYNINDSKTFWYRFPTLLITSKSNLPYTPTLLDDFSSKSYDIKSRLFNTTLLNIPQEIVLYPITGSLNGYLERVQDNENLSRDDEMCYEVRRFQSFNPIRVAASPLRLAQSGFYATGSEDETRCYSCGATHRKWELFDRPDMVHRMLSPGCPHLTSGDTRNIPTTSPSDESSDRIVGVLQDYPKDTHSNSKSNTPSATLAAASASAPSSTRTQSTTLDIASAVYPQYKDRGSRLESYKGWRYPKIQTPENLAEAGFYYAGYRDCVRCFYCGVGLKTWEEQDNPWVMHVRWRSSCDYVRKVRGEQFIQQALNQGTLVIPEDQPQSSPQPMNLPSRGVTNELIVKAEEMGFQRDDIDKAICNLAGSSGESNAQGNVTLETLLEKLILMTSAENTSGHRIEDGDIAHGQNSRMTPNHTTQTQIGLSETILSMPSPFDEALSAETLPRSCSTASHTNLKSIQQNTYRPTSNGLSIQGSSQTSRNANAEHETRVISPDEERRLAEENESLREESTCKICMDNPCCIVFLPCGHLVTCAECAPALRRCPICRSYIRGSVRAQTTHRQ